MGHGWPAKVADLPSLDLLTPIVMIAVFQRGDGLEQGRGAALARGAGLSPWSMDKAQRAVRGSGRPARRVAPVRLSL